MGTALIVESIPDPAWRGHIEEFVGVGTSKQQAKAIVEPWMGEGPESKIIDTFNSASHLLFLDHVASLEGYKDSALAMDKTRWKNLPYYMHAIWLPLNGRTIDSRVFEADGWPAQISTASGLRKDLKEIASVSDAGFGNKPELFDLMLGNPKEFYRQTDNKTFSDSETLQWIWFAFNWGAELAEKLSKPAWQAG